MLSPGTVVGDKYEIVRELGRGGMGAVFEATHLQLGTRFALKFMHPEPSPDRAPYQRFLREARASASLKSEHVCRVVDVGDHRGVPYMVMELLEGIDLGKLLAREGALPLSRVREYMLQVCKGVAEAHALGIVHRDLKPGNLMLSQRPDGSPLIKVLDFGIVKVLAPGQSHLTGTSHAVGSPAYMSPEQLHSSPDVDARSDIWSLGAIMFELITGRQAFVAPSYVELAMKIDEEPAPELVEHRGGLAEIVARCLEKDRERRFPTASALAAALSALDAGASPMITPPQATRADASTVIAARVPARSEAPTVDQRRAAVTTLGASVGAITAEPSRWRALLISTAASAIVVGIAMYIMQPWSGDEPATNAAPIVHAGSAAPPAAPTEPARAARPSQPAAPAVAPEPAPAPHVASSPKPAPTMPASAPADAPAARPARAANDAHPDEGPPASRPAGSAAAAGSADDDLPF